MEISVRFNHKFAINVFIYITSSLMAKNCCEYSSFSLVSLSRRLSSFQYRFNSFNED